MMIKKSSLNVLVAIVDRAEKVGMTTSTALKDVLPIGNTLPEKLGAYSGEKLGYHPVVATKVLPEWQQFQLSFPILVERCFVGCNLEAGVINQYDIDHSGLVLSNLNPRRRDLPC